MALLEKLNFVLENNFVFLHWDNWFWERVRQIKEKIQLYH
jgi:hypothetical protein